jgi:hypothetical protein
VVVAREGRALSIIALGAVTVTDNQLTAHGSDFLALLRQLLAIALGQALTTGNTTAASGLSAGPQTLDLLLDALGANVVLIMNSGWSNEFYAQISGLSRPPAQAGGAAADKKQWFVGGNVLFNDNQVSFDALDPVFSFSLCAVLLFSYDQVTMNDNQVACDLALDFMLVDTLVAGIAVQMQGNRLTEGLLNCFLSGVSVGLMNSTALNVGTHCIVDIGLIKPSAFVPSTNSAVTLRLNVALVDASGKNATCQSFESALPGVTGSWKYRAADVAFVTA